MHKLIGKKQSPEHVAKRLASTKAAFKKRGLDWIPPKVATNTIEGVWKRIDKRGEDDCWNWTGSLNRGYGRYNFGEHVGIYAHRIVYMLANPGSVTLDATNDLCVLHRCDNPACCNPKHLFLGTHADNMLDKAKKGRAPKIGGERSARSKLTNEEAREIRWMHGPSATKNALALLYDVSVSTIKDILSHTTYKDP